MRMRERARHERMEVVDGAGAAADWVRRGDGGCDVVACVRDSVGDSLAMGQPSCYCCREGAARPVRVLDVEEPPLLHRRLARLTVEEQVDDHFLAVVALWQR